MEGVLRRTCAVANHQVERDIPAGGGVFKKVEY
jgi:hypothetical protein